MRLPDFDYSQAGAYFITICTKQRQPLFWDVGANCVRPQDIPLSAYGHLAERQIQVWKHTYPDVSIEHYVIMPNHIHFLISITADIDGRTQFAPTISRMVKQFKGAVSKQIGHSIWQKSFHDRIIRNEAEYQNIWRYIEENPLKWELDKYYQ